MVIRNATREQLQQAAAVADVRLQHCDATNKAHTSFRVKLTLTDSHRWQRVSGSWFRNVDGTRRKVHAVCFHGHLLFMAEVYRLAPGAVIASAVTRYTSIEDLWQHAEEAGARNVGSHAYTAQYDDLCLCRERAEVRGEPDDAQIAWDTCADVLRASRK